MKVGFKILGCPKNVADCEILAGILKERGHEMVFDVEDADLVIIDTCAFIEDAKVESIDEILDFVEYKKYRRDLKIAVKGCLVQRYGKDLMKEIPEVDMWFGVLDPNDIANAVERGTSVLKEPDTIYRYEVRSDLEGFPYAYVKIADGCDRRCTFCAIPLFKGRYRSREMEDLKREVEDLVRGGKKEIILVSQDSTAYGFDLERPKNLVDLLESLNSIDGDFWLRVMYLHPDHITFEMIDAILELEKVVPYFEIPVQHGSDPILKRMGRTRKSYELMDLFDYIRKRSDMATIRTTVMVGFPGEGEGEFQELLDFLEKIRPDRMGVFVYSDEEGTVASTFEDKVEEEVAKEREEIVSALIPEYVIESNSKFIGKTLRVLVDEEGIGRTFADAPEIDTSVFLEGEVEVGNFVDVEIESLEDIDMKGKVIGG